MPCILVAVVPGAQIIDLMMLVVDCTKGMQTQTAEVQPIALNLPVKTESSSQVTH